LTEIIITEVLQGIKKDSDFEKLAEYLLEFPIYGPKSIETYLRAAQLYRDCRKKGRTVRKTIDCIIAAICLENDLILLHQDSDFDQIETCTNLKCYKI
ncbi:MAG: PIN domain nuclease, partial [Pseudomonadota bacterium]